MQQTTVIISKQIKPSHSLSFFVFAFSTHHQPDLSTENVQLTPHRLTKVAGNERFLYLICHLFISTVESHTANVTRTRAIVKTTTEMSCFCR